MEWWHYSFCAQDNDFEIWKYMYNVFINIQIDVLLLLFRIPRIVEDFCRCKTQNEKMLFINYISRNDIHSE